MQERFGDQLQEITTTYTQQSDDIQGALRSINQMRLNILELQQQQQEVRALALLRTEFFISSA